MLLPPAPHQADVEQPVLRERARAEQIPRPVAQRPAQPAVDGHREPHLRPLEQCPRHVALQHPAQDPLGLAGPENADVHVIDRVKAALGAMVERRRTSDGITMGGAAWLVSARA